MPDIPLSIGIDFGATTVRIGVVFLSDVVDLAPPIATQEFKTPELLLDAIVDSVERLRSEHSRAAGVGIGVPGLVDFEQGIVRDLSKVEGWTNCRLKYILSERLGLPVVVENDANCMTYAEWKRGAGRGLDHLIAITLGSGVGGGVVANGNIVRGARFGAGEIGQMSIDWQGTSGAYGNLGSLEEYIGTRGITATAESAYQQRENALSDDDCSPSSLTKAGHHGDPTALKIWDEIAAKLASSLMSCCWLLNPQAVIIGGRITKASDLLFTPLTAHLYAQLSAPFKENLMVLPARFGSEAIMIGAASLGLEAAGVTVGT